MKRTSSKPARQSGMTMMELMVAVGLMGLVVAIGSPALSGYMRSKKTEKTMNEIVSKFDRARHMAVSDNNPYEIFLNDPVDGQFWILDDDDGDGEADTDEAVYGPDRFPDGVTIDLELIGDKRLVFRPTGILGAGQGGKIVVTGPKGRTITLEVFASGTIQRADP